MTTHQHSVQGTAGSKNAVQKRRLFEMSRRLAAISISGLLATPIGVTSANASTVHTVSTASATLLDCGGENASPCPIWVRIPSCNEGLVEDFAKGKCVRPAPPPPLSCGKLNEQPCPVWVRIPSCDAGLAEDFLANKCVGGGPEGLKNNADTLLLDLKPILEVNMLAISCIGPTGVMKRVQELTKAGDAGQAANAILTGGCIDDLLSIARSNGYHTITVGAGASLQLGFGANSEFGVAIDVDGRYRPVGYVTDAIKSGLGAGVSGDISISFYKSEMPEMQGDNQGFAYSGKALAGGGASIWYDYDGNFVGASGTGSAGFGGEAGVYLRSTTALFEKVTKAPPAPYTYRNARSGLCLDVAENKPAGRVVIDQCGTASQRPFQAWTLNGQQLRNNQSGMCLDVAENRDAGRVVIDRCNDTNIARFQVWERRGDVMFNPASGRCLDVFEDRNGGGVVIANCGNIVDRPYQFWRM